MGIFLHFLSFPTEVLSMIAYVNTYISFKCGSGVHLRDSVYRPASVESCHPGDETQGFVFVVLHPRDQLVVHVDTPAIRTHFNKVWNRPNDILRPFALCFSNILRF